MGLPRPRPRRKRSIRSPRRGRARPRTAQARSRARSSSRMRGRARGRARRSGRRTRGPRLTGCGSSTSSGTAASSQTCLGASCRRVLLPSGQRWRRVPPSLPCMLTRRQPRPLPCIPLPARLPHLAVRPPRLRLQSSVTCHNCGGRFTMYEPFWDLRWAPARPCLQDKAAAARWRCPRPLPTGASPVGPRAPSSQPLPGSYLPCLLGMTASSLVPPPSLPPSSQPAAGQGGQGRQLLVAGPQGLHTRLHPGLPHRIHGRREDGGELRCAAPCCAALHRAVLCCAVVCCAVLCCMSITSDFRGCKAASRAARRRRAAPLLASHPPAHLPLAPDTRSRSRCTHTHSRGPTLPTCLPTCLPACLPPQGAEAFHCETCRDKTPATKHLRLHRFPEVLVLQIKRFKYKVG